MIELVKSMDGCRWHGLEFAFEIQRQFAALLITWLTTPPGIVCEGMIRHPDGQRQLAKRFWANTFPIGAQHMPDVVPVHGQDVVAAATAVKIGWIANHHQGAIAE